MVVIHSAIPQALYESQMHTVHMLKSFIMNKMDDPDKWLTVLDDFSRNLNSPVNRCVKSKKDPSKYNMFIGDRISEYKKQCPELNGHELMRMATAAWRSSQTKKV